MKKLGVKFFCLSFLVLAFNSCFLNTVFAQTTPLFPATTKAGTFHGFPTSIKTIIFNALNFVFGVAGAVFVVMFIIGGIQYLTAMGNEEVATRAKKLLIDAVIGIIIVVGAWALSDWVLKAVGGTANWGK